MANYLKFTYQHIGNDSSTTTFTDVDDAKSKFSFADWDFTGRTPQYTLEDSNTTLAVTISFTDAESHVEMKAFHNSKLAAIGELAAGVGHEINNPLAVIYGNLELLMQSGYI